MMRWEVQMGESLKACQPTSLQCAAMSNQRKTLFKKKGGAMTSPQGNPLSSTHMLKHTFTYIHTPHAQTYTTHTHMHVYLTQAYILYTQMHIMHTHKKTKSPQ